MILFYGLLQSFHSLAHDGLLAFSLLALRSKVRQSTNKVKKTQNLKESIKKVKQHNKR